MRHASQLRPVARRDGLIAEEVGDELLVYDSIRLEAHTLNRTARLVWNYSDGVNTVADIAELAAAEIHSAADEHVVWYALERLREINLLKQDASSPAGARVLTRRELIRHLGVAAAAALPLIASVAVPSAAHAASPVPCTTTTCCW